MLEEVEVAVTLPLGVVHGMGVAVAAGEAGAPAEVDAHGHLAAALVEFQAVDEPGLGQAEGGGEEVVVHGALRLADQGRMRHCASFDLTPACSPGCARQGFASPGWRPPLTRTARLPNPPNPLKIQ